jgi:acetyl-CoA carboxylase carboxyl transferase subunit beta
MKQDPTAHDQREQSMANQKPDWRVHAWMGSEQRRPTRIAPGPLTRCPQCGAPLPESAGWRDLRVCPSCQRHFRLPAAERIELLVDPGSFRELDRTMRSRDPLHFSDDRPYEDRLAHGREQHGRNDAILTGEAAISGQPCVLAVLDFEFMGGSMGVVVGERIARAADRARKKRLPLIVISASGGARMQEGMFALQQMAKTVTAIKKLRLAGLPYISVLTDPTTGGVFASFASLGDIVIAEPKAQIGFAGPRVAERLLGAPLPPDSHHAENLLAHGHLDAIVPRQRLRTFFGRVLRLYRDSATAPQGRSADTSWRAETVPGRLPDAWREVELARAPDRPTALDYISAIVTDFIELHGDHIAADDPAVVAGLGWIGEHPVAIASFERGHGEMSAARRNGQPMPAGFRKAHRVMTLAARWSLPVVTLVDTPGAYPGVEAEEHGLAAAIAQSLSLMSDLPTPIIAAIIGEGGSGGALALALADRVLMQEHAIYSVIAPEGAAAILFRDTERAPELAGRLRITASELHELGFVDEVIREPALSAAASPEEAAALLRAALVSQLQELRGLDPRLLARQRQERYLNVGNQHIRTGLRDRLPSLPSIPFFGKRSAAPEEPAPLAIPATLDGHSDAK